MGQRLGAGGGKEEVSWRTGYLCEGRGWLTLECRSRYGLLKDNQQLGHATNSNMDPIRSFAVWRRAEALVGTYHRRPSESAIYLPPKCIYIISPAYSVPDVVELPRETWTSSPSSEPHPTSGRWAPGARDSSPSNVHCRCLILLSLLRSVYPSSSLLDDMDSKSFHQHTMQ